MKKILLTVLLILFTNRISNTFSKSISSDWIYDILYSYKSDVVFIDYKIPLTKEVEWATRLIQAESLNESELGKIAIVQTIQNRVRYNTSRGRNTSFYWEISRPGQIDGYGKKNWYRKLKRENVKIAYIALYGERKIPESIYFWHNECTSTDKAHIKWAEGENGKLVWMRIDNHTFCHTKYLL